MITGDGRALISRASTGAIFRGKLEHQAILHGTESWKFSDGNKTIMVHPQGRFKADSAIGIAKAMAAGIGIAALPTVIARPYVAAGRLAAIMTRYTLPEIGIFVVRPPGQHPSRKVRVLIDLLVKTFARLNEVVALERHPRAVANFAAVASARAKRPLRQKSWV